MSAVVLSCVNLKGGVGKTALAVNFAAFCGAAGKKALLIDLDPQTNATFSCITAAEWKKHAKKYGTVADLLGAKRYASAEGAERTAETVICKDVFHGVDLIPSHLDLFTVDLDLASATARETKLRRAISPLLNHYDVVVCDCPPNLTIPTQNALAASTHYAVPISPDYLSAIGVALLLSRVKTFSTELELSLELAGIVLSRVGRPAGHRVETTNTLRNKFGSDVLPSEIKERAVVSEAASKRKPVYKMGASDASTEFRTVSEALLERMGVSL